MIKKISYELNYRIKGKKLSRVLEIDFIPNIRHEESAKIEKEIFDVQIKWNHIKALQQEVELLLKEDRLNTEAIKDFRQEIEKATKDINSLKMEQIIERRLTLIKNILIDNGYGDDEELMSDKFWNESVDPVVINEFLTVAINKDIDKKKVVH